jgi:dUTP pyrophosphatase
VLPVNTVIGYDQGMRCEIKILDERLRAWGFPGRGSKISAGVDLFACLNSRLRLRLGAEPVKVSAGFALLINDTHWAAMIYPRSGQAHERGLVLSNAVGVVDPDYQGEIFLSLINRGPQKTIDVEPGERIGQMIFTQIGHPDFVFVENFSTTSARGTGGFGSTGR